MKRLTSIAILLAFVAIQSLSAQIHGGCPTFVSFEKGRGVTVLSPDRTPLVCIDPSDDPGIKRAADNLAADILAVTGRKAGIVGETAGAAIIAGSIDGSRAVREALSAEQLKSLRGAREKFLISILPSGQLLIAGSDKRGTIYGIYEFSEQMGVSPWYYWADVPVARHESVSVLPGEWSAGEPAVKYRGIFLNDEWPCLGSWAEDSFGGFNSRFYEKVFELILRLRGNFLWPAMWNSAFYDDDPLNGPLADEMGIVMGTSHHEPMGLAQQDWKRRGSGPWDYSKNKQVLQDFWRSGMERCKDWEALITVGMRGDGDEAMSAQTNTRLLEEIVRDQRKIISSVTGRKAEKTPQVWALYKEVQDYFDAGMRVPDDVTLLLCDDNWGNVRRLPMENGLMKPRRGGYGMYYHFDYVGAPRNSKWVNITQVQRTWEQMSYCYAYGIRELWVVNVGDLKPMEYPIDFFMDMAWNPSAWQVEDVWRHTEQFCAQSFGAELATEAAAILDTYPKYNRRITVENLSWNTYSLENYDEWARVRGEYDQLLLDAFRLYYRLPDEARAAYDQLILYPVQACANLYDMYHSLALAKAGLGSEDEVHKCFVRDAELTKRYHECIAGGKWNHIMDQVHIGYRSWQDPQRNIEPTVEDILRTESMRRLMQPGVTAPVVSTLWNGEGDGYASFEAEHYTVKTDGSRARWITIPNLGRTLSAITLWPPKAKTDDACVEYVFDSPCEGKAVLNLRWSTVLNWNDYAGMRCAFSIDGGAEQVININKDYRGELGKWQLDHVIDTASEITVGKGRHTLRLRFLDPGLLLQKILIDWGGAKPCFLWAPENVCPADRSDLIVLYDNDVHCYVDQYARMAFVKDSLGADLVVSSGDFLQGGPLGAASKGEWIAQLASAVGYDAMEIGNHEFDYGIPRMLELREKYDLPLLSCNLEKKGGHPMFPRWEQTLKSYKMVERKGRRIAFVGITTPAAFASSKLAFFQDDKGNFIYRLREEDLARAVQTTVDLARAQGADYVVALAHLGLGAPEDSGTSAAVLKATSGIDVLLDGHSHDVVPCDTIFNAEGRPVLRSQSGSFGHNTGVLRISDDGAISLELIPTTKSCGRDAGLLGKIGEIESEYVRRGGEKVGTCEADLPVHNGKDMWLHRNAECGLGDFYTDAFRQMTGADVALIGSGGIRENLHKGDVSHNDIFATMPFGSTVCTLKVKGSVLLDLLEFSVHSLPLNFGSFYQVSGMKFEVDCSVKSPVVMDKSSVLSHIVADVPRRVSNVKVLRNGKSDWEALDPEAEYLLVSNSYLVIEKGDGCTLLEGFKYTDSGETDVSLVERYLQSTGGIIPAKYKDSDNRIKIK